VDQLGAYQIKERYAKAILIWIVPPSMDELAARLQNRATENQADMQKRLMIAQNEMKIENQKQLFDYVVQNHVLAQATLDLINIFKAEMLSGSINC